MSQQRLNVQAPIHELLAARWSPRAFQERPVELVKLASCLEAARWAPSCYNDQPWRFVVADRYRDEEAWQRLLKCLAPLNQRWAKRAAILILTCAATKFRHNHAPNRWSSYDAGQAVMALVLQAVALGLVGHQMAGFDAIRVRAEFEIPEHFEPMTVTALGYPGDPAVLDEDLRERELAPRQRYPLEEIAFSGRWGISFAGLQK
jgi:nitroreductase